MISTSGWRGWRLAGPIVSLVTLASAVLAQDTTGHRRDTASTAASVEQDYLAKRQATLSDIRATEQKLAALRIERIQVESRVDSVTARASEQRASQLLMSHEATALRSLDSVLTASQDNLLSQRDRFLSLGEAVRRRAAAELIVVVRVDSGYQLQSLDNVSVSVDSAPSTARHYSPGAIDALNAGAIDELYQAHVLPATHVVSFVAAINGSTLSKALAVDVPPSAVTYVQFAVRNGQLALSTWTSRSGTSP